MSIARLAPALMAGFPLLAALAAGPAAAAGFDEAQARSRMQAAGYANVSEVHEGNLGEWMARAVRDGRPALIVLYPDGRVALRQDEQVPPPKPVPGLPGVDAGKP